MTAEPLVIVGDAFLDTDVDGQVERLCPDAPVPVLEHPAEAHRPGGAALAALLAAAPGTGVVLVAPFGTDPASAQVAAMLRRAARVVPVPLRGSLQQKTRLRGQGRTLLRVDKGEGEPGPAPAEAAEAILAAGALLVCDYGRGVTADTLIRSALACRARQVPLVWDPHLRGTAPVPGTRLAAPNQAEAERLAGLGRRSAGGPVLAAATAAERLLQTWPADSVAVTLGSHGALLGRCGQAPLVIPAPRADVGDTCGAGDQFAVAAAAALMGGALVSEAVTAGVAAATRFLAGGGVGALTVAGGGGRRGLLTAAGDPGPGDPRAAGTTARPAGPPVGLHAAQAITGNARADGGTVVATGGCFDVLHAGHVSMLRAARALGDCLVVCMNSDASVRRLKGQGRPLNPAADRAAVLAALDCVDAIVMFGEDTPERVLSELRPDIWVKGGDYDGRELPEAAVLRRWGGRVITVPYLSGRSTSRLASAAVRAGASAGHR